MTPRDLYLYTQQFAGCPPRPSCVSSVAQDELHAIAPLEYSGTQQQGWEALQNAVHYMGNAEIAHSGDNYLHVVFQTPRMHYHDDVELLVRPDNLIDVRSISRFGYGDMGVNRARVEEIRSRLDALQGRHPNRKKH